MKGTLLAGIDAVLAGEPIRIAVPPWHAWLALALVVQRDRQRWHLEIMARIAASGTTDETAEIPGLPGWSFHFHGIGCCLIGPEGERLDVDANDPDNAVIDPWFFASRVESIVTSTLPGTAERRLWRWRPAPGLVIDGLATLGGEDVIRHLDGRHCFTLAPELEIRVPEIVASLAADPARWLAALEPEGDTALRPAHRAWIHERIRESARRGDFLDVAIIDAPAAEARALCLEILAGVPDYAAGHAIELLRKRPEIDARDEVAGFAARLSPTGDPPFPAMQACAYLLERAAPSGPAWLRTFSSVTVAHGFQGNPFLSEYAMLALQFVPAEAMQLVRDALRSTTPMCVREIAALLAVIDQRWCHRELSAAFAEPRRATHSYLAEALRRSSGDLARRRASADTGPHRSSGIGYTFAEVLHANAEGALDSTMTAVVPVAHEIRAKYSEHWAG